MDVRITPALLAGTISAIPSKSDAHRLLICAALADGPTQLELRAGSEDIEATMSCLEALGAGFAKNKGGIAVRPIAQVPADPLLDCGESGSTLRFLLPLAAALTGSARFTGRGRLPQRPIGELKTALEAHGVTFSGGQLPFSIAGKLQPGHYSIPGNISSQYITGLLLAQAAMASKLTKGGESALELATELESAAYVDITRHALKRFQVMVDKSDSGWSISSGQSFRTPGRIAVDGDWSNAAFFLAAGAIGRPITLTGLDPASPQGDKQILEILAEFGASVEVNGGSITVSPGDLNGITIDLREIPDALPILAVVAACATGQTRFTHGERLRLKESDRLRSTAEMIRALGGQAVELPDGLIVQRAARTGPPLTGGVVDGSGDHRIVMAAAIAATTASGAVTIIGAQAVRKSYPHFFEDFNALGGKTDVL